VSVHEGHDLALDALVPGLFSRIKARSGKPAKKMRIMGASLFGVFGVWGVNWSQQLCSRCS